MLVPESGLSYWLHDDSHSVVDDVNHVTANKPHIFCFENPTVLRDLGQAVETISYGKLPFSSMNHISKVVSFPARKSISRFTPLYQISYIKLYQ